MFVQFVKGMGEWRLKTSRSGQVRGTIRPFDWKYHFRTEPRGEEVPSLPPQEVREVAIRDANLYLNRRHGLPDEHYEKQA